MTKPTTSVYSEPPLEVFRPPPPEQPRVFLEGPFAHPLVKVAEKNGWELVVKYSRGPWSHATQRKYKIVHLITALFIRGDTRLAAIWVADVDKEDGAYSFYKAIRNDQLGMLNATEMKALLNSQPEGAP